MSFCATSCILPGTRITEVVMGYAPDLIFERTATYRSGIEVAGRTGGRSALRCVVENSLVKKGKKKERVLGKRSKLLKDQSIKCVYVNLWGHDNNNSMGFWEKIK